MSNQASFMLRNTPSMGGVPGSPGGFQAVQEVHCVDPNAVAAGAIDKDCVNDCVDAIGESGDARRSSVSFRQVVLAVVTLVIVPSLSLLRGSMFPVHSSGSNVGEPVSEPACFDATCPSEIKLTTGPPPEAASLLFPNVKYTSTCTSSETCDDHNAALLSQSFDVQKFNPVNPSVDVDGRHAVVATHSGYVLFFLLTDNQTWERTGVFFHESEDDTDASVSLSGGIAAVGFPDATSKGMEYAGLAYIYELDWSTNKWSLSESSPISPESGGDHTNYGFGTAIRASGDTVVVGAPGYNDFQGSFYIFRRESSGSMSSGGWVQKKLIVSPSPCDGSVFGGDIRIDGNTISVGADCHQWMYFYQYRPESNTILPVQEPFYKSEEENLIGAVAMSDNHFLYSKYDDGVYIYHRANDNDEFTLKQHLNASHYEDVGFGSHLTMKDDMLVVSGDYHVYVFTRECSEQAFEELLSFESLAIGEGMALSFSHLSIATNQEVYSMSLKAMSKHSAPNVRRAQ